MISESPGRQLPRLSVAPYHSLDFTLAEIGMATDELLSLPWMKAGVARASRSRLGVLLRFGAFVGRVTIPNAFLIELQELVPGTVATLAPLTAAGRRWTWSRAQEGPATVPPWVALAQRYAAALGLLLTAGVPKDYVPVRLESRRPRGAINIRRTLAIRAKGHPDVVASNVRLLTEDIPTNRVALAAAVRAEVLLKDRPDELRSLRTAIRALEGATLEVAPDIRNARQRAEPSYVELLELAALLIAGVSTMPVGETEAEQPVDVWFDAATIFEAGMRHLVERIMGPANVRAGLGDGVQLFDRPEVGHGEDWPANPDIVVKGSSGTLVLDAKYRRHGATESRPEIYQLIAHAAAYDAKSAALVVPRLFTGDASRHLGTDRAGRRYDVIVVDVLEPATAQEELGRWLVERGALALPRHSSSIPPSPSSVGAPR